MDITYKEIQDTFNALGKTEAYLSERWSEISGFLSGKRFLFVGCGSSFSLAKSLAAICNMHGGAPASALAAGDILLHAGRYKEMASDATVVFISRSGRTSELIKALEALRSFGASLTVISLLAAEDSPLGGMSDLALCTPWAFDESVCQTRTVTNFYFMGAYIWARYSDDQDTLDGLSQVIQSGSDYMKRAEKLAKELAPLQWSRAVVLADAELEGLAEEGALVFKEVCQLPANYYHCLDVRHGPIVLFGQQTLVLIALGESNELELNLLADLKAKGSVVVAFSDAAADIPDMNHISYGHPLTHMARGIPFILLCQLTAYEKSKVTGANPDQPTGLDSWIAL
ncbi:MAG: SIS domain-containing protein [Oscillospiraceae bacterium]|nr:SIS domain-containing protein [Oscillospiraceae bacterium]